MRKQLSILWPIVTALVILNSCDDEPAPGAANTVGDILVSPPVQELTVGQRFQFSATFRGESGHAFAWTVSSGPGTISELGEYTAPQSLPAREMTASVKAILQADSGRYAYAQVIIRTEKPISGNPKDTTDKPNDTTDFGPEVCFTRDVLPILISNCAMAGCHDSKSHRDGFDFSSYAALKNSDDPVRPGRPAKSKMFKAITEDDDDDDLMPPPPNARLTSGQVAIIRRWIELGALDEDCGDGGACDTSEVRFSTHIAPLVENNCRGCHSGASPAGKVSLDSYRSVRSVALDGRLYGAVAHEPGYAAMPLNASRLPDCSIRQVRVWVRAGAPDN